MKIKDLIKQQQLLNIDEVCKNIESKEYEYKINQVINLFNGKITKEEIIYEVKNSKIASLYFAKPAIKQNIIEKEILYRLQKINNTFKKLPNNGKDSIRFDNKGNLIYGSKPKISINLSKSVDYIADIDNKIYYFAQKYTSGNGGSQDNQYNDAIYFIECALKNKNRDFGLGLVLDGDYYDDKLSKLKERYSKYKDILILSIDN